MVRLDDALQGTLKLSDSKENLTLMREGFNQAAEIGKLNCVSK